MGKIMPADLRKRRFQAVLMKKQGESTANVAKNLKMSRSWVKKWYRRFETTGDVSDMKHPGRPKVVTNKLIGRIKKMAKNENIGSIRKIHSTLKTKGINISSSSVHNVLKSEGLSSRLRGTKPF